MCVIMIASQKGPRPSEEMVKNGWDTNDAGAGIAWRENGYVRWKKGIMKLDEIQELVKTTPMPFILHFRIPTIGGRREDLTHPFPIEKTVSLDLEGKTKGNVLFHNGHWSKWKESCLDATISSNSILPVGKWSDTRGMAFMASIYGIGVLELIDEKAVVFGPSTCEVFPGLGWKLVNDIWCSNDNFDRKANYYTGYQGGTVMGPNGDSRRYLVCRHATCTKDRVRGREYCFEHRNLESTPDSVDDSEDISCRSIVVKEGQLNQVQAALKAAEEREKSKSNGNGGGDLKLLPFSTIDQMFKSDARDPNGKRLISRNMWKKARRKHQKDNRKMAKLAKKIATEKFHQMTDAPIVITH